MFDKVSIKKRIRLLGVGVSDFKHKSEPVQMSLIPDYGEKINQQWESVDAAVDSVLSKFGSDVIQKAVLIRNPWGGKK